MTRAEQMKAYKAQGHTSTEVAARFSVSSDYARRVCSGIAPQGQEPNEAEIVAVRVREKTKGRLEYVSGYTTKDKPIIVRCNSCGGQFERTYHNITTNGNRTKCPHCAEKAKAKKNRLTAIATQKKKAEKFTRSQLIRMKPCTECGSLFIPFSRTQVRCSAECIKRSRNRNADARLNKNNTVDKDITLTKLYRRDNGVCYICGRRCDWSDYSTRDDGTVIAGDKYPSIEHVVPLSKNGLHSWSNVRLACRGCNVKKNAKIFEYSPL